MTPNTLHTKVLPSLLAGTSRHPLPDDSVALAMLSLMGQALRFDRPPTPESFTIEPEIQDNRKILADRLRRPLLRTLTARNTTEHPARALARAFDRLRLRPHPFDLPFIESFVRSNAEKLGSTAQHWTERQRPEAATRSYFDPEVVDESNWTQAKLSRRVAFFEQRRQEDAGAARTLLELTWSQEDADARFRLLQGLQNNLGIADQPFLSSLEKDRAPRVRTLALRYLARLGAATNNPALAACLERIKQSQSGFIRKRTALQLEIPANLKDQAVWRWIRQTFTDVSFAELASAFKLSDHELIEAAAKDEPLLVACALMATDERRFDLLESVVANLPNAWQRLFETGLDTLGTMPEAERRRWQEILVHPFREDLPASYQLWDWLHRITDTEAPPWLMSLVLETNLLAKVPEHERGSAFWLEVMAAICPASHRHMLHDQITQFDPAQTVTPVALLGILDGMENDRTNG